MNGLLTSVHCFVDHYDISATLATYLDAMGIMPPGSHQHKHIHTYMHRSGMGIGRRSADFRWEKKMSAPPK